MKREQHKLKTTSVGMVLLFTFLWSVALCASAQETASSSMKANPWAPQVPYDLGDVGVEQPVRWGVDTAWDWDWWPLRATNHMQECVSLGRVTLDPRVDQSYSSLSSSQQAQFDKQLGWLKKSGVTDLYLLAGNVTGQNWQTTWRAPYINDIALSVQYLQSKGYNVTCISPFNEPDYSANHAPGGSEQAEVARQMRQNAILKDIDVCGPSTLNPDRGLSWWNSYGSAWQVGNTHQLAGSADSFANFYAAVQRSGKKSTGDEMHNINDALVGMNYGMSEGIWWSDFGGYTRAELGRASNDGVRVGWKENRSTFTSAAVFRRKSQPLLAEVFMGSSERQANNASYSFVSQDRLVYYDGEGPTYEFTAGTPGGNGYQNGQTNAESVVELTYGEDVSPGPIQGGTFKIVNKATGKLLTAASLSSSSVVNQQAESRNRNQSWVLTPLGQRDAADFAYMTVMNAKTTSGQLYLNGVKWGADSGAAVNVVTGGGNECERWHFRYMGDGYYVITNHDSGLSLEGSLNNSATNTTSVVQWARTGTDRQLWRLVPADATVEFEAPLKPVGLKAVSHSGSVFLSWTKNTEDDLLGYMVYRYNDIAGLWECIGRQVKETKFIDNTCPKGQEQRYRIRSIDQAWNVSEPSDEVTAGTKTENVLVGQWLLSTSLIDGTDNHLDGVSTGVTFGTQGEHSGAHFDGTDDYINLPYQVANLQEMTFAAWIYPEKTNAWQRIFDFGRNTENYILLTPNNGSGLRFEICKDGVKQGLNATQSLAADQWTHVAVTLGAEGVSIYLNGELNASTTSITFRPADVRPLLSYIGRSMFDSDPFYKGYIGDITLFNYALDAKTVKALLYHEQLALATELLNQPMYRQRHLRLATSIAAAERAIYQNISTESIQEALGAMHEAMEAARPSIEAYQPLQQALQNSEALAEAHPQEDDDAHITYNHLFNAEYTSFIDGEFPDENIPEQLIVVETFTNQYLMTDVIKKATEERPVDITYIMKNADFATNTLDGWTLTTSEESYHGDFYEGCFEVYNHTFDLAQKLYGMPSGIYRMAVQGFYRCGARENIATAEDENAVIYVVDAEVPLNLITRGASSRSGTGSWYEYETGTKVPDDMAAAHSAFNSLNRYRPTSAFNTVQGAYDATLSLPLQIGLRKTIAVPSDWTIVNNFTLRYLGDPTATGIEIKTNDEEQRTIYDLMGRRVSTPQKGIYIINGKKVLIK